MVNELEKRINAMQAHAAPFVLDANSPVFPVLDHNSDSGGTFTREGQEAGLTVRDLLACHAMQGLIIAAWRGTPGMPPDRIARNAYKMADAMLSERHHIERGAEEKGGAS